MAMFTCPRGAFCQYTGVDATCCWNVASPPTGGDVRAFGLAAHFRLSMTSHESSNNLVIRNHYRYIYTHLYVCVYPCAGRWSMLQILSIPRFLLQKRCFRLVRPVSVKGCSVYLFRLPGQLWRFSGRVSANTLTCIYKSGFSWIHSGF